MSAWIRITKRNFTYKICRKLGLSSLVSLVALGSSKATDFTPYYCDSAREFPGQSMAATVGSTLFKVIEMNEKLRALIQQADKSLLALCDEKIRTEPALLRIDARGITCDGNVLVSKEILKKNEFKLAPENDNRNRNSFLLVYIPLARLWPGGPNVGSTLPPGLPGFQPEDLEHLIHDVMKLEPAKERIENMDFNHWGD